MARNEKGLSNIIVLHDYLCSARDDESGEIDAADISEFIVDMLDTLLKMTSKKQHYMLTYLLSMARDEALEIKKAQDEKGSHE